jgi:hypothetical protein
MAGSQAGKRPAQQASHGNWWSDAGNTLDQTRRVLEAKGRAAYEAALREGRPILARTEAELRELGAKVAEAEAKYVRQNVAAAKGVAAVVKNPRSVEAQRFIKETKKQATAALHGAGDAVTLGLADKGSAAVRATLQSNGDFSRWNSNYHADMDQERAQDAYDEAHFGDARHGGEVAGTVASLLIPGADLGAVARIGGAAVRAAAPLARTALEALPALGKYAVPTMQ